MEAEDIIKGMSIFSFWTRLGESKWDGRLGEASKAFPYPNKSNCILQYGEWAVSVRSIAGEVCLIAYHRCEDGKYLVFNLLENAPIEELSCEEDTIKAKLLFARAGI